VRADELAWLGDGSVEAVRRLRDGEHGRVADEAARWATSRWYEMQIDLAHGREPAVAALLAHCAARTEQVGVAELTAACLVQRFAYEGDPDDLDRSIDLWRHAHGSEGSGSDSPLWLSNAWRSLELGAVLIERARLTGSNDDLDEAIAVLRRALRSTRDPLVRAICLGRSAACDHEEFLRTGRRAAADRALRRYRRAIDGLRSGAPARPMFLTECGTLLQDRFDYAVDDHSRLDEALALGKAGLAAGPPVGPDRACHLVNIGTCWDQRYAEFEPARHIGAPSPPLTGLPCC